MLTSPSKCFTGTIFLHAHLQAVYYNCAKFHLNPMSRLRGVVLKSPSLHTERISEYKLNYPPPPTKFWTATTFLHALQVVHYNCVKLHKNPISCLGGVALTRYMPSFFRESTSWIIYPSKCWTATIFLHAHLQVVYYNCVKLHNNPISRLGGVGLTRYTTPLFVKV